MLSTYESIFLLGILVLGFSFVAGVIVGLIRQRDMRLCVESTMRNLEILRTNTEIASRDLIVRVAILEALSNGSEWRHLGGWAEMPMEERTEAPCPSSQPVKRKPGRPPKIKKIEAKNP